MKLNIVYKKEKKWFIGHIQWVTPFFETDC